MHEFKFFYNVSGKQVEIQCKISSLKVNELKKYEDYNKNNELCKTGCPNYAKKWACPPFTPSFTKLSSNFNNSTVVLLYCDLKQFSYIKSDLLKVKASNAILKSKLDGLLRNLESHLKGKMLSNGSCKLCKPCNCKLNLPCKKPLKMRYSMEAVGLDVCSISNNVFNHEILWYKNKKAPLYSSVVSCILTKEYVEPQKVFEYSNQYFNHI